MKTIPLTQGKVAIVDDADYEWLNQWKWYALKDKHNYYAQREFGIRMHRVILGILPSLQGDHINHDTLDDRRCNLRACTDSENKFNQIKRGNLSIYKGVRPAPQSKKWEARIQFNKKRLSLGLFATEIEAAQAYDKKAHELFGKFALTNF